MKYDVIIVGAGPAGLAAAHQIKFDTHHSPSVLLIEKGKGIATRTSKTSGFGGAGLFSDGKLVFSDTVGGNLTTQCGKDVTINYLKRSLNLFNKHFSEDLDEEQFGDTKMQDLASKAGLGLVKTKTFHLGTDGVFSFSTDMLNKLINKVTLSEETGVLEIKRYTPFGGKAYFGVRVEGTEYYCKYLILAPGREGADWLNAQLVDLKIKSIGNRVDLGVRVELPNSVVKELVDYAYDFKLYHYAKPFDDQVRTFCVCPGGKIARENYGDLITCNGHSYSKDKTDNTNFAILVSIPFGNPIDPIKYGKSIVSLANNISDGGVIVQRLTDLEAGRRTTDSRLGKSIVTPTLDKPFAGDLSLVIPHRYLTDIMCMLRALNELAPGVTMADTLLYGVEVKFYSNIIKLSKELETGVHNLFCIGDGAGVSRGILQATASGLIVADAILRRANA